MMLLSLATVVVIVMGGGTFTVVFLQQQQQASAFEYRCDSIIDPTCMHQGLQYYIQPDKTPFILPFP
jgi:hypothetical protein